MKNGKRKESGRHLKSRLLICLLYVAILSTATYAWFTINNKPKVYNLSLTANGAANLFIADDLGGRPGEYKDFLDLQTAVQTPAAMADMEMNPVTTDDARIFYEPVYEGDSVTGTKAITDETLLHESFVYKKTFYLKAGSFREGGEGAKPTARLYDIMLLGPGQGEENTGCVIRQAAGVSAEGTATAANSVRIAFLVEGQDIAVYEPNSSRHHTGTSAVNALPEQFGGYKTIKQPVAGGDFEGGSDGNSEVIFTIKEEEDVRVTMLVWIEGTDEDCTNSIQMNEITGNIQFISKAAAGGAG